MGDAKEDDEDVVIQQQINNQQVDEKIVDTVHTTEDEWPET